jgi:transketolase
LTATQVVSMPCWELFEAQSLDYKQSIFPAGVCIMSIEVSVTNGWHKWSHAQYGMSSFGAYVLTLVMVLT